MPEATPPQLFSAVKVAARRADFYEAFQSHPGQPNSTVAHCITLDEEAMIEASTDGGRGDVLAPPFSDDWQSFGQRLALAPNSRPELHNLRLNR